MVDFRAMKKRLGPPPVEASDNLKAPEIVPLAHMSEPNASDRVSDTTEGTVNGMAEGALTKPATADEARIDGRTLRRSNRTVQFATRVTPEFDLRVRQIAQRDRVMMIEVLERALEYYDRSRR